MYATEKIYLSGQLWPSIFIHLAFLNYDTLLEWEKLILQLLWCQNASLMAPFISGILTVKETLTDVNYQSFTALTEPLESCAIYPKGCCRITSIKNYLRVYVWEKKAFVSRPERMALHAWAHILISPSPQVLLNEGNLCSEGSHSYNRKITLISIFTLFAWWRAQNKFTLCCK